MNPVRIILTAIALLLASAAVAQNSATKPAAEKVYNIAMVEQKPEFPGGKAAMYKWIADNIKYPASAVEKSLQGRVVVEFQITADGDIENVRVLRGLDPALDQEAVRLVKSMPRWRPGRNNGQPVRVSYLLPVTFKL